MLFHLYLTNIALVFALTIFMTHKDIGKAIYETFIPKALASGQFKPMPEATVVGTGLDTIQVACDKNKAGASAAKFVVKV